MLERIVLEGAWRSITHPVRLELATSFGDLCADYPPLYAAITPDAGTVKVDGTASDGEWPAARPNGIPLRDPAGKSRGSLVLTTDGRELHGIVRLLRSQGKGTIRMTFVPVHTDGEHFLVERNGHRGGR